MNKTACGDVVELSVISVHCFLKVVLLDGRQEREWKMECGGGGSKAERIFIKKKGLSIRDMHYETSKPAACTSSRQIPGMSRSTNLLYI